MKKSFIVALTIFVAILVIILISSSVKSEPKVSSFCEEMSLKFKNYMEQSLRDDLDSRGSPYTVSVERKIDRCNEKDKIVLSTYTTTIKTSFVAEEEDGGTRKVNVCAISIDSITLSLLPNGQVNVDYKNISSIVEECK